MKLAVINFSGNVGKTTVGRASSRSPDNASGTPKRARLRRVICTQASADARRAVSSPEARSGWFHFMISSNMREYEPPKRETS